MTETSRVWNGTTVGDATEAPYDAPSEFAQILSAIAGANNYANKGGVWYDSDLGFLLFSTPGANSVRVASGRALVYGAWYQSDANVDFTVATPAASTRIDRIVLRKDWTTQTVRLTQIAGVEGGAAPALVQVAGTTWDVPVGKVTITTGGVMTLADEREFLPGQRAACRVYHNAAQSIANGANADAAFNSETYDTNGMHDTVTNNNRITIVTPGLYEVIFYGVFDANGAGVRTGELRRNNTDILDYDSKAFASGTVDTSIKLSTQYVLAAGDFVNVVVYQNSGGPLNLRSGTSFMAARLS